MRSQTSGNIQVLVSPLEAKRPTPFGTDPA